MLYLLSTGRTKPPIGGHGVGTGLSGADALTLCPRRGGAAIGCRTGGVRAGHADRVGVRAMIAMRPYLCRAVNVMGLAVRERSGDMGLAAGRHACAMAA